MVAALRGIVGRLVPRSIAWFRRRIPRLFILIVRPWIVRDTFPTIALAKWIPKERSKSANMLILLVKAIEEHFSRGVSYGSSPDSSCSTCVGLVGPIPSYYPYLLAMRGVAKQILTLERMRQDWISDPSRNENAPPTPIIVWRWELVVML